MGVRVLFGLADYRYEVLYIMEHAADLENRFGCGPHTVSVPRLEPAPGSAISEEVPYPVSDDNFRKIIAVIRMAMPYTGIILSTRESKEIRSELFRYGVSRVSAGSRTTPGGYSRTGEDKNEQFSLGGTAIGTSFTAPRKYIYIKRNKCSKKLPASLYARARI